MNVIPFGDELQQFPRALHILDPTWLYNDLFVGAPQGDHWVFFRILGGLFWLAGPIGGAMLARISIWVLTAGSLLSLGRTLEFKPLAVVLGAALFIAYGQSRLGGETIVGEAIARHLAYPLVLFALAGWIRGRFLFAAAMLGCATSVHVLVGAWVSASILGLMFFDDRVKARGGGLRLACSGVCLVCALPGLLSFLPLVLAGNQPGAADADQIFISFRHPHHLSPGSWPLIDFLQFAVMFAVFIGLGRVLPASSRLVRLRQFVWVITIVTVVALVVGLVLRNAFFLKLHPYRFAPPLTSLMTALCVGQLLVSLRPATFRWVGAMGVVVLTTWFAPHGAYHLYQPYRRESDVEVARLDALHWLKDYAPANASVLANPAWSDVQWESRRAAPASFKLIPFESPRINEWYKRITGLVGVPPWSQPGQVVQDWIREAYDELSSEQLLRIADQLGAHFTVTTAPCTRSREPDYSNAHFCIYSSGQAAQRPQNYLIVRYDDFSPISPYDGRPRKMETEKRLFDLAGKYNAKVSAGVIPFPVAEQDAERRIPAATPLMQSWLTIPSDPWVQLLRQNVDRGVVEPALHGFEHRKRSLPEHRPGEYRRQPLGWQRESTRLGRDAMATALQKPVRVFIPPWNAWDANTVDALKQLEFEWLSPDQHQAEVAPTALRIAPQCTADPVIALAAMQGEQNSPPGTIFVLVTHPFDFEKPEGKGEAYFQALEKVFAFADSSPRWTSAGFSDLPDEPLAQWTSRFRAAVQWNQARQLLDDLAGNSQSIAEPAMLYRPSQWYQDNLWRLRLPLVGILLLSAVLAGATAAWFVLRFQAARLFAKLGLVASAIVTLYLAVGAWQIAQRDYAIRGLRWLAICAAAGAAIGFAFAAIRRRQLASDYRQVAAESIAHDRSDRTAVTA
jgi:hypothetical protein